jgi:hypothetical protein
MTTNACVTEFFTDVFWKVYCADSLVVELVDGCAETTVQGCVGWDVVRWRILANKHLTPRSLHVVLFHELAHILFGDTRRGDVHDWDRRRAAMTGKGLLADIREQRQLWHDASKAFAGRESKAHAWGTEHAAKWWPTLAAIDTAIENALKG